MNLLTRRGTIARPVTVAPPTGTPPVFQTAGAGLTGVSRTNSPFPVPSGVVAGDIVLVHLYVEALAAAITPPTGFSEITFTPAPGGFGTAGWDSMQRVYWKRATGADTGTYTFAHPSVWTSGAATRYSGCVATGTPVEVLGSAWRASDATVTPAVSGTTLGANRLLVWGGLSGLSVSWAPPAGFTERFDSGGTGEIGVATLAQLAAGATGSLTGTASAASAQSATLLGLLPA